MSPRRLDRQVADEGSFRALASLQMNVVTAYAVSYDFSDTNEQTPQ